MLRNCRNYRNLRNTVLNLTGYEDYDGYDVYEAIYEYPYYNTSIIKSSICCKTPINLAQTAKCKGLAANSRFIRSCVIHIELLLLLTIILLSGEIFEVKQLQQLCNCNL